MRFENPESKEWGEVHRSTNLGSFKAQQVLPTTAEVMYLPVVRVGTFLWASTGL